MKNTTLLTFFIFSFCYSLCQVPDWQKMMIEPNAKFNDIVNEVTPYLEEHEAEFEAEAEGSPLSPENFTRWQNFWIDRVSDGTETNAGSFRIAKNNTVNSPTCNSANGSNWTCVGPFFSTARQGIVIASSFDPDDASNNTLYIGTKFSGIWKTTNAQAALPTWRCLQDGTGLPPIGVSGIAVLPISGGIKKIYAGSGTSFSYGTGLYESLNGGATWTVITTLNILDRPILKLLVEPVAIPTYLFIMTNKEILKMNMATHAVTNLYTYSPQLCSWWSSLEDMCFDPNNSNKLYVTSTGFNPQLVDEFWEHCGSPLPGVSTPLNSYVNWQEGSPVSYFSSSTDQPIVESTSPSSSGGGNIYLDNLNTSDREFTISGFNSSSYTNLSLTFECKRLTINSDPLTVEFSIDGITWTQLSVSIPVNTTWNPISPTGLLPSTSNLRLRFSKSTTSEFRIDNIKMTNTKCAGMNSVMKKIDLTTTLVTDITPSISNVMSIRLSSCPLPANNNNIYAFCHQEIGSSKYYHTIIYNGTSWSSAVSQSANGVFDEAYQVSPKDPTVMYTAGITLFKITNSGSVITPASTASDDFTHADIRTILIEPGSSTTDRVWIGTDGGVSFSAVGAGVGTWSSKNGTGLNNTEFYGLAVTEGDQHFINGGAQDNHQYLYFHGNWINWGNGDGYHSLIYPKTTSANPYFVIGEASSGGSNFDYSYGNIFFERDQPTGPPRAISVPNQPSREDRPIHEFDNKIYTGYVDIFEATPPNLSTWTQKTNFFGNNTNLRAAMRQFYVSKNSSNPSLKTGYILFQYQDYSSTGIVLGALFKNTVDITDQSQWIDISNDIRIDNGGGPFNILQRTALVITDFTVDPNNFDRIWLTCSGFGQNRVIYSPDGGATWSDFSSGLSSWPVNCIIYQENSNDALYIGTDAGVFYRNSSMTQWQCYDEHLPVCVVKDLEINYCYQKLRAATFGRAIWESDLAPSPSTISTGVTNWTTDRNITNDIVIPSGATLTISANINIAKGRKITVKSGGVLILNSPAHLFNGCQEMWDGVYGESGSTINVRNSTIEHAYQAFNLKDQCSYVFEGNTFDANYISIKLGDNSMRHSVIGSMIGNHFHCNSNLPPYFGTVIPGLTPNTKSYCGIYIYNVDLSSFGKTGAAPNNFSNMESGIVSYYSNLTLTNASFSNLHDHNHYRINFGGCGIYSQSGGNYLLKYVSGASFSGPDFSDCYEGIKIENQNFSIFGCSFDKMNTGIEVKNCRGITGSITDNILKCSDRGIVLLKNDFAKSILAIRNNIEIAKDLTTTRAGAYGIGV